jgi:hypothetical protein
MSRKECRDIYGLINSCACAGAIVAAMPANNGAYSAKIWACVTGIGGDQQAVQRWANAASQPTSGPQAAGSVDLGFHGYKAANHWNPSTEAEDLAWEAHKKFMTGVKS